MARDFVIGCVGKPSSGKSTFFNAVCINPTAKTAAHPFTTIEPNHGVAFFTTECPCTRYNVQCAPAFGSCKNGVRKVPVKLLDVAGLIPGANEGRGIGNKFLDDLRHADVLMHIIDVSGRTNEKVLRTCSLDLYLISGRCNHRVRSIWRSYVACGRDRTVDIQQFDAEVGYYGQATRYEAG